MEGVTAEATTAPSIEKKGNPSKGRNGSHPGPWEPQHVYTFELLEASLREEAHIP